jgi:hypothetical protein
MANPRSYYYYYYWVFATVSTHLTEGTCNIKLGDHREENTQTEGKLEHSVRTIWNPPKNS